MLAEVLAGGRRRRRRPRMPSRSSPAMSPICRACCWASCSAPWRARPGASVAVCPADGGGLVAVAAMVPVSGWLRALSVQLDDADAIDAASRRGAGRGPERGRRAGTGSAAPTTWLGSTLALKAGTPPARTLRVYGGGAVPNCVRTRRLLLGVGSVGSVELGDVERVVGAAALDPARPGRRDPRRSGAGPGATTPRRGRRCRAARSSVCHSVAASRSRRGRSSSPTSEAKVRSAGPPVARRRRIVSCSAPKLGSVVGAGGRGHGVDPALDERERRLEPAQRGLLRG